MASLFQNGEPVAEFKLVLLGDCGVGKTQYLQALGQGVVSRVVYVKSLGTMIYAIDYRTSSGNVRVNVWDGVGLEGLLQDRFIFQAQCALIMFDVTNPVSYEHVPHWYNEMLRVCKQHIPFCILGSKILSSSRAVQPQQVSFHRDKGIPYYEVCPFSLYNLHTPILWLIRKLAGKADLDVELPQQQPLFGIMAPPIIVVECDTELPNEDDDL